MARVCQATGKRPSSGNNVSHSNRKTRRRFLPNLQMKTLTDPITGMTMRARVSTRFIRTLAKMGKK